MRESVCTHLAEARQAALTLGDAQSEAAAHMAHAQWVGYVATEVIREVMSDDGGDEDSNGTFVPDAEPGSDAAVLHSAVMDMWREIVDRQKLVSVDAEPPDLWARAVMEETLALDQERMVHVSYFEHGTRFMVRSRQSPAGQQGSLQSASVAA